MEVIKYWHILLVAIWQSNFPILSHLSETKNWSVISIFLGFWKTKIVYFGVGKIRFEKEMNIPKCKTNIEVVKMLIISTPVLCTEFTRRGIVTWRMFVPKTTAKNRWSIWLDSFSASSWRHSSTYTGRYMHYHACNEIIDFEPNFWMWIK